MRGGTIENEHRSNEQEADSPHERPRAYIASLADYNDGILHGEWIDMTQDVGDVWSAIRQMLQASPTGRTTGQPAEEWAIHDFESFGVLRLSEYESIERVVAVATGIAQHGPAFAAWIAQQPDRATETNEFEDDFLGTWTSVEAYVEELIVEYDIERTLDEAIEGWLRSYIAVDVEAIARDMQLGGDISVVETPDHQVWLFRAD